MSNNKKENFTPRAPIVVILGHVDHGKTTILDYIKKTNVAGGESGGITQHIGAYEIEHKGKKITFLDTPGHEAFSAMRSRGANVADIAVLVIAGDEGMKPQTKEALAVIKKTETPFIVAINKVDKPGVFPDKVKRELSQMGVLVETLAGDVPSVNTSAKTGIGIEELLDVILLMGEMRNLQGDHSKKAEGVIIESYLDKKRGPIATVLITDGILRAGDAIATKSACGKIKTLESFQGKSMKEALPSQPCIVMGFSDVPSVGESFTIYDTIEEAESATRLNKEAKRIAKNEKKPEPVSGQKSLNIVLKVDVAGSVEAIEKILEQLPDEEAPVRIVKAGAGDITESDIDFAISTNARIVGFRVKAGSMVQRLADDKKIRMAFFDIIYNLLQGVRAWQQEMIKPKFTREEIGRMKTLLVFFTEGSRQIVGGRITDGEVTKGAQIEVARDNEIIGKGRMISLQKNKKDIDKAVKRDEIGILFDGNVKIKENDILIFYVTTQS